MISRRAIAGILCVAAAACSRDPAPAAEGVAVPADVGAAPSARPASDGPQPGAAATPAAPIPLGGVYAGAPGQELPIASDGTALVEPGAAFRVEIAAHLVDGRLALHDEEDDMVASTGTTEVGSTWTRYRLSPQEPLRPGTSYQLRVDGAVEREAHDPAGRTYLPVVVKLKTTGERPPPAAKKPRAKRRP